MHQPRHMKFDINSIHCSRKPTASVPKRINTCRMWFMHSKTTSSFRNIFTCLSSACLLFQEFNLPIYQCVFRAQRDENAIRLRMRNVCWGPNRVSTKFFSHVIFIKPVPKIHRTITQEWISDTVGDTIECILEGIFAEKMSHSGETRWRN